MQDNKRLLIVGNPGIIHIGAHLMHAAEELKLPVRFCDVSVAFKGPLLLTKLNWWFRAHRPNGLRAFSQGIVQACSEFKPRWLLSTGLVPVDAKAIAAIKKMNISCLNYLTDDPWNSAHHTPWFMKTLPLYDHILSPRRANIEDLKKLGCPKVIYLPFAYAPELHFPQPPATPEEESKFACDIVFVGGADKDRVPYIYALIKAGFNLKLYGDYWQRSPKTKAYACGHIYSEAFRKAICAARVALCLIRRANRDGHSMRTFEISAIGACMLVEDTQEHRDIFGEEEKAVVYFKTIPEMVKKAARLLGNDKERVRLAEEARSLIVKGKNTYKDRLISMLV